MSHSELTANAAPIDPRTSDSAVRTRGAFSVATVIKFPSAEIIPQRNSSTTRRVCPHLLAYPDKSRAGKHTLITDDGSSSHEGVRGERAHTPATRMPIVQSAQLSGGFSCPLLSMRSRVGRKPRSPAIIDLDGDYGSCSGVSGVRSGRGSGKPWRSSMTTISRTSARRGKRPWPKHQSHSGNDAVHRALAAGGGAGLVCRYPVRPDWLDLGVTMPTGIGLARNP